MTNTSTPTASDLTLTKADKEALRKIPDGWFEWFDFYGVRCPEFRLRRLVERGMVERKLIGKWPDSEWRYRVKASAKEIEP